MDICNPVLDAYILNKMCSSFGLDIGNFHKKEDLHTEK